MKLVATRKVEQNVAALDPWTLVHFSSGLALGLMELSLEKALGVALGYELVEQYVERRRWGQELFETSSPERPENAAMDLVVFGLGHWLGGLWNRT
ncbi:MAG TPA: hypothetical protein VLL48_02120 [Longimicrobiales bacterium]|nr:hypothetical protein [Longimicrobiales bacterium]